MGTIDGIIINHHQVVSRRETPYVAIYTRLLNQFGQERVPFFKSIVLLSAEIRKEKHFLPAGAEEPPTV